jgi:hypothetical protein
MLGNAAQAQEITAASLKGMSESSAVRMGCGAAFIGDMNGMDATVVTGVNTAGIVQQVDIGKQLTTRTVGALCLLAIIFVALRVIPKEKKEVIWRGIRTIALVMFLGGAYTAFTTPYVQVDDFTGATLWASTMIAVPVIFGGIVRGIWAAMKAIQGGFSRMGTAAESAVRRVKGKSADADQRSALPGKSTLEACAPVLTVSVKGQEITFRKGDTQITRVLEAECEDEPACATK